MPSTAWLPKRWSVVSNPPWFKRVRDAVLGEVARNRLFTRPVDVAIDIHNWLYYGDSYTPDISRADPDRGTDCAYKFATICIVDPSVRFTLG